MIRIFAVVIALTAATASLAAQLPGPAPPRDAVPAMSRGTGIIRGRVVAADTGEPLRRVRIRIDSWSTADARGGPRATLTGDDGRYELTELPPGRYHLTAVKGGYVDMKYGQRRPFQEGRPIEVADGQAVERIDFALPRGAVVSGRIVDEAGEPVTHAWVSLARHQYLEGVRRLNSAFGVSSNDRGEFRIFGAAPGDYYLVATFDDDDIGGSGRLQYVPTYYPGVTSEAGAQRLTLGVGQELADMTLMLARGSAVSVSGTIRSADGTPVPPLMMVSATSRGTSGTGRSRIATAGADGTFTLGGLVPGTYVISAHGFAGGEVEPIEVAVDNADVTGVSLVASRGHAARGRLRFDTETLPADLQPAQVFLMATAPDRAGGGSFDRPPRVRDDWSFELTGLRGRRLLRAASIGQWQLKAVFLQGQDVTDVPIDFSTGDVEGIEIVLSQRHTTLSGMVTTSRGSPTTDASVVVFVDDPDRWGPQSRFIGSARPDQQGRYTIGGLPPARYLAIALEYLEPGQERDPEALAEWRRSAQVVTLAEGESRVLDLMLSAF